MNRETIFPDITIEQQLCVVAAGLGDDASKAAADLIAQCGGLSLRAKQDYEIATRLARGMIDGLLTCGVTQDRSLAGRAVIAAAALRLPETLSGNNLPQSILSLMPAAVARLAESLEKPSDEIYDESSDLYRKDLRFVIGQAIPCGAQDVDLFSSAPWTTLLKNPSVQTVSRYLSAGGWGVWFRIHTDPRNTGEFDEAGWRRCYKRIADLLESRPDVRGMVGTSWFYDPQLLSISPRLAYLQNDPLSGGAFMLRNGPGEIHTQRATLTSPSRRKLYEDGKYLPICWSVLWPRKELIAWAAAQAAAGA